MLAEFSFKRTCTFCVDSLNLVLFYSTEIVESEAEPGCVVLRTNIVMVNKYICYNTQIKDLDGMRIFSRTCRSHRLAGSLLLSIQTLLWLPDFFTLQFTWYPISFVVRKGTNNYRYHIGCNHRMHWKIMLSSLIT